MPTLSLDDLPDQTPNGVTRRNLESGINFDALPDTNTDTLRGLYRQGASVNPDAYAKARQLARATGAPAPAVLRNPQPFEALAKEPDWAGLESRSPETVQQLIRNTELFHLTKDDPGTLADIVQFVRDTGGSAKAGLYGAARGSAGTFRAAAETAAPLLDFMEKFTAMGGNPLRRLAEGFDIQAQAAGQSMKAAAPQTTNVLSAGWHSGVQSLVQNLLLLLPAGLMPGGEAAMLTGLSSMTAGQSFQDAREKGIGVPLALQFAASQGVIEFATEKLPVGRLLGDIKAGSPFYKMVLRQMATEIPGEQVATLLQDLNEWAVLHPEQTFGDYAAARPSAAVQTLIATMVGVGGNVAVAQGAQKVVSKGIEAMDKAGRAEDDAQRMGQLLALAAQAKLLQRAPDTFAEFLQTAADESAGAITDVYIDARALGDVLAQAGIQPGEIIGRIPALADQYQAAIDSGSDVIIPIGEFTANIAGSGLEQALLPHLRTSEDALSLAQAQEQAAQAQDFFSQGAQRVLDEATNAEAALADREVVKQIFREQLAATNRFTPDVHEAYATLVGNFYSVLGKRMGLSAEAAYARYPYRVVAETQQLQENNVLPSPAVTEYDADTGKEQRRLRQAVDLAVAYGPQQPEGLNQGPTGSPEPVSVVGVHFSREARSVLRGDFYGTGLKGAEGDRVSKASDQRLRSRVYFYVDEGNGVRPEAGVGEIEHRTQLTNLYDARTDPLGLWYGDLNGIESRVLDSGFSGYYVRDALNQQGAAVLLGDAAKQIGVETPSEMLGQITIEQAMQTNVPVEMPTDPVFAEAVDNTPGAQITVDGLLMDLVRFQKPEQEGAQAIRTGVFYLPKGSPNAKYYRNKGTLAAGNAYGGTEAFGGQTLIRRPLFAKGATGGKAPEAAYDLLKGKGEYQKMRTDVVNATVGWGAKTDQKVENVQEMLQRYGADPGIAFEIVRNSQKGNLLPYAVQENIVAHAVRAAGYDAVVGYSKGKAGPFISEVFDVREQTFPARGMDSQIADEFLNQTSIAAEIEVDGKLRPTTNSKGQPLATTEDGVRNFWRWFGDSKVVDADGKPLVMYHYSGAQFNEFKNSSWGGFKPVYFNADPKSAKAGAREKKIEYAVYLSMKNPVNTPDSPIPWGNAEAKAEQYVRDGFDGIYVKDEGGVSIAVFRPEQIKSATGNSGQFNPGDANILAQKNRATFSPSTLTTNLLETSDLTSFLHETGHFFLEVMADVAAQTDAPAEVRQDMDTVLRWFGIESLEAWRAMPLKDQRQYHEKFAESFEQYLFEGKAPSAEMRTLFRRFRDWMVNVYRDLKRFMATNTNADLNPEISAVFDRLIATDEQISEAEAEAGMLPDFDATNEAIERLQSRSLRDLKWVLNARSKLLKQLQRDIDAKRKAVEAEVTAEVRNRPEYAVQRFLKFGDLYGEKVEGGKLSTEALRDMYGDGPATPWRYLATNMLSSDAETALQPAMVADLFHFESADAMVRAIVAAQPEAAMIEGMTDQRVLERYGDVSTPKGMEQAVNEAIHNEARARFVATEIRAMREGMNPRERSANGGSVNVLLQAAKDFAANLVSRRKVRDLRAGVHTAAEARAAKSAEKMQAAGDTAGALAAKREQLMNHYAAKYVQDAKDEVDTKLDYLRKFDKGTVRAKIPVEYMEQIDGLLERFDLRRGVSLKTVDKRASLLAWVQAQQDMGLDPSVPEELLDEARRKSYKEMTVEEFRGLVDTVRNIEHLGRLKDKLLTLKDKREFAAVVDDVSQSILDNATKHTEPRINAPTMMDRGKDFVRGLVSSHRKLASLAYQMDGFKDGGAFWNAFVRTMNRAADSEAVMREKATQQLAGIFDALLSHSKLRQMVMVPAIGKSLSLETRLAVALNWGNDQNRQRVMDGDNWSKPQVDAILSTLTADQLRFVQKTWDFIDSFWPEIKAKEERVSGIAPEKVQASPFSVTSADGTVVDMRGGYYPIKYDADRSSRAAADNAAEITKQMLQGHYTRATTRRGHTKARADTVNRPVRKDIGVVFQHVEQVAHDLSWHEWLIDANRLLRNGKIDSAIRETMGPEVVREFNKALQDIAAGDVPAQSEFEHAANYLRQGTTVVGLGWNLFTSLLQPLGLTQSMVRIGPQWVGKGLARWMGGLAHRDGVVAGIYEKSDFMRLRGETMNREIREIRNKVSGGMPSAMENSYFYLIQKTQQIADIPTWLGQYEKSLANGATESEAVDQADQAVRDAQGSGEIASLARIQRGGPLFKLFTNFYSFFNTTFNLTAERFNATDFKKPKDIGRFAVDMLLLYTLPAVLGEAMRTALRSAFKGDDDWDEKKMADILIRSQLNYLLGTMVGLREASAAIQGFNGYQGPAGTRFFSEVAKLSQQVGQGEADMALARAGANTAGILLHLPTGQVMRSIEGAKALAEGETDNPLAPLFGPPLKH